MVAGRNGHRSSGLGVMGRNLALNMAMEINTLINKLILDELERFYSFYQREGEHIMTHAVSSEGKYDSIHREDFEARYDHRNLNHTTMVFMGGRGRESLNGNWLFTVDPYDTGLRQRWYGPLPRTADGRLYPWDYQVDYGEVMPVPSCWNMVKPEWHYYEGSAWYARAFAYKLEKPGERLVLRIGAANYDTKVFLNGEFLGNHLGGYTPFFVELTGKLQAENLLQLCVNNQRTLDRVPMRNTDWFNYGGVYRDVELVRLPSNYISDVFAYLVPNHSYRRIRVEVAVDGAAEAGEARVDIPELGIEEIIRLQNGRGQVTLECQPELWSPEIPKRYEVIVTYGEDRVRDLMGFRQVHAEGNRIYLNGKPLFLRGISVHEDDEVYGKVSGEEDLRRRYRHAKELGCNFLRLAHYPHTEMAAELADELGFLLWEEIPVYWAIAFENPDTYRDAENQLLELVKRDRNRASVIIWSVGNENPDSDARLHFMKSLAQTAKSNDPSRLVSAACLVEPVALKVKDRLVEFLDVVGINEYYGWYNLDYEELKKVAAQTELGKPVVISETGADALAGHHGPADQLFTEEYMADVYRRQVAILREIPYIAGMSPWILYDFRAPRRQNPYQKGFNRKGLIALDKETHKQAFHVLQGFYREIAEGNP